MPTDPAICGRGSYYCSRFEIQRKAARSKLDSPMSQKERRALRDLGKG